MLPASETSDKSDMGATTESEPDTRGAAQVAAVEAQVAKQVAAAVHETRGDAARAAAETAKQHEAAVAAVRAQLEDAECQRARLGQDLAVRVESARLRADAKHAAHVAALEARAVGQIAAVRRAAEVALQAQETDLEALAAGQVEVAVRAEQAEAARILVETMKQHDVLAARARAEAQGDVTQAQDQLTELEDEVGDRVEAQVAARIEPAVREARDDAKRAAKTETAQLLVQTVKQHDIALARVRAEAQADATQANRQLAELKQQVADRAEKAAAQIEGAVPAWARVDVSRSEARVTLIRLGLVKITGVVVLAGLTGTLIGWFVSLLGLF